MNMFVYGSYGRLIRGISSVSMANILLFLLKEESDVKIARS